MSSSKGSAARLLSRRKLIAVSGAFAGLYGASALGFNYDIPFGSDQIQTVLNSTITAGAGVRMESQSSQLIGKANLSPNFCGFNNVGIKEWQSCQGVFRDQTFLAKRIASTPGAATINGDDGDLNYNNGDFYSAVVKLTEDFKADYKGFGIFARALYFHDFVNDDFTEYHPNRLTRNNVDAAAITTLRLPPILGLRLPYPGGKVFNSAPASRNKRTDSIALSEVGDDFQFLDSYFHGKLPLWGDRELSFKFGRQTLNWGESTTLVANSLNNINPVDLNNVYRIGGQVEEFFTPTNMAFLSFAPLENTTVEGYYQLEWEPDVIPAPGSYFSTVDVGSKNDVKSLSASFGQGGEDPLPNGDSGYGIGRLVYNPLSTLGASSATFGRLPDVEPKTRGQFGVKLDHYFDSLNNGTDLGLYYEHYHSRLPYVSFYAANPSCARGDESANGVPATSLLTMLAACPNLPLLTQEATPTTTAYSSILSADSVRFQLQYPEHIDLFGVSFNTTLGSWSLQGEVAYRPAMPLQVDQHDLFFAALGPTLTNCSDQNANCTGQNLIGGLPSNITSGIQSDGSFGPYSDNHFIRKDGTPGYNDYYNVGLGVVPGVQRSFPNFVIPYRGGTIGDNQGCPNLEFSGLTRQAYGRQFWTPGSPCWIRGWERFQVYEFNLGTTRVLGRTDNWIGADQIQIVGEWGAMLVPELPALDKLQLQGPGTNYHASAGADGSGADGSRQACSTSPDCSVNTDTIKGDALRFNPHQQDRTGYPDELSWGYRVIGIIKYESVLPGISLQPTIFWSQDVMGTSPGPGGNFVAGAKQLNTTLETRYKSSLAFDVGYTWYWGGGQYNMLSDRDFLQFYLKYQF
jgi:hypothetical protein